MSTNDALLLIGHGSARYPDAGALIRDHAGVLRSQGQFSQVEMALLNGRPTVDHAVARMTAPAIRVVPFFMEDGYFSRVAVPAALAATKRSVRLCPPVGVHAGLAAIIRRQALAGCADLGVAADQTAVVVVGHGSAKAPGRALALHRHVSTVLSSGLFARVEAACLEEAPFVAPTLQALSDCPVVVIGFFANQGGHVVDDVPALIAAEQARRAGGASKVRFHACVAADPDMIQIILDQAAAAER